MDKQIFFLLEKKLEEGGKKSFYSVVSSVYKDVDNKAGQNKKKHFKQQKRILYASASVSIFNVIVTFLGSLTVVPNWVISLFSGISSGTAIIVTFLLAKKEMNQYSETWLRHQAHQAAMRLEIIKYVYSTEKYEENSSEEALNHFISNMILIWENNQNKFASNMGKK